MFILFTLCTSSTKHLSPIICTFTHIATFIILFLSRITMDGDDGFTGQDAYGESLDNDFNKADIYASAAFHYDSPCHNIPQTIKQFIVDLQRCISDGVLCEIQNLYEITFCRLTEQYFKKQPWPEEREISDLVKDDPVFLILYKELYFRHIYANLPGGPTLEHRFDSFVNYGDFFSCILNADTPVPLDLPDVWLWGLIDEFVYQFQSFVQYRACLHKTSEELTTLKASNIWSILSVLNVLYSLVEKSNIRCQLEVHASRGDPDSVAGDFGCHPLYKKLGYFSLVGLLRIHSLFGDYYHAIQVMEHIKLHKKRQFSYIPACQISISYYLGFAYMMTRRYSDAIHTFNSTLLYVLRTKQLFQSCSNQIDWIHRQVEKMYHLLAICLVLHPQCVDEAVQQMLKENYPEEMYKMQSGDLAEFETCFVYACPKFLSPSPLPYDAPFDDYVKEPFKHQTQIFMSEVQQQKMLPTIRSYLKLYTTMPLSKLATFLGKGQEKNEKNWNVTDATKELIIHLLCFKHKMKNVVRTKETSGLVGKFQSDSEVDFYIDNDMVHVADTKVARCYGDFFMRRILKLNELNNKLCLIKI